MTYAVDLGPVRKDLRALDDMTRRRVLRAVMALEVNLRPPGAKKLRGDRLSSVSRRFSAGFPPGFLSYLIDILGCVFGEHENVVGSRHLPSRYHAHPSRVEWNKA